MGQLPQQINYFLLTGQVFSWISISSWKYIVQWVCQVIAVGGKSLFVLSLLEETKGKIRPPTPTPPPRKITSECDLGMNAGKLHESFRNLLDWGICQLKGRRSCSAWLLFFSAEGNTFKASQHLIFHYLSPNRETQLLLPFFFQETLCF